MIALGIVLLILAAAAIVFGVIVYGNGAGLVPDEPGRDTAATRKGVSKISMSGVFGRMKTSVRDMFDEQAGRDQRLMGTGAFAVLVGLVLVVLALLAFLAAAV